MRPVYPIPTLEENIHRFNQGKIFSVFDIKDAFQTIELTHECSLLTTMHTPWGRYHWTRLPFGVSSAPEELYPDKIKFKMSTAPFMGHILTPEGLKPSNEIATAILDMPQPSDKAATRRFLGTITYLSKSCPNLSEVVHPLCDLTHIKQEFLWSEQHSRAFSQAKELVSKAPCLRYYDVNAPVILQVDASEYGLGAVLLQPATDTNSGSIQWQPVAYSSSSLSPTEQRYAQIEKETLAIVHAFHKFDQLLFGKPDITVHSDHQPLETIFKRPLASAPRRLQSMMLALQRYSFHVEYHKGSPLLIVDTLSRAPLPTTSHKTVHEELVYRVEFESNTPDLSGFQDATLQDIRTAATTDPEQVALRSLISTGWPNDKTAVPELARRYCVFWPFLHTQITNMCQSCVICARHVQQHPREPFQPYPVPTLPWQLVSQDLFELNGRTYMVTVDHYSDFYEIDHLPTIQSSAVIQASKQHFGCHGIPHTLITDNGAQFTSDLFRTFSRKYGFNHVATSPY